jgi:hypothetical protein
VRKLLGPSVAVLMLMPACAFLMGMKERERIHGIDGPVIHESFPQGPLFSRPVAEKA